MKKFLVFIFMVVLFVVVFGAGFYLLDYIVTSEKLSNLEEHEISKDEDESIVKEFQYDNMDFVVSRYYDDTSAWSNLRIMRKVRGKYYILQDVNKCDVIEDGDNIFVKNRNIYVHCIGKEEEIGIYTVSDFSVSEKLVNYNFSKTPNISLLHMKVDDVDDKYIYLSSEKVDLTIDEGDRVKCPLDGYVCSYD